MRGLLHRLLGDRYSGTELPPEKLVPLVELLLSQGVRDEAIGGSTAADLARRRVAAGDAYYEAVVGLIEGSR